MPSKRIQSTVHLRQKVFLGYRLSSWIFGFRFPCHFVWESWFVSCRKIRSCNSLRLRKCPPPTSSSFSIFLLAQYIYQLRGYTSSVCRDEVICITFSTFTWSKGLFKCKTSLHLQILWTTRLSLSAYVCHPWSGSMYRFWREVVDEIWPEVRWTRSLNTLIMIGVISLDFLVHQRWRSVY